jgi:hypothetical protein
MNRLSLFFFLAACGGAQKPTAVPFDGPAANKSSTSSQREKVAITIYNQNFGLVREVRNVDIGTGKVALEYRDVAAYIQPETVALKSIDDPTALTIFEQNYRYDLLTPAKLLEKYVGKKVKLYRWNEEKNVEDAFEAEVLSVEGGTPIYKINGEVTYGFPGRVAFPEVPANLIAKPSLVWLLGSSKPKQKVELTYLTSNMTWKSDYVLNVDANDATADLTGWVTLDNRSGTSFESAQLKLVAGDVNKVIDQTVYDKDMDGEELAAAEKADNGFKEEGFFEYHLYTLGRPTSVLNNEKKQATLLEARGIGIKKKMIFFGASHYYRGHYGQVVSNQKIGVYLDIENKAENKLGMPLPKGVVRVYKADSSGARQFIGEDHIDHTPRDEKLRIKMGDAFDVVGDRKQMKWTTLGVCASESDWEIELRNHKDTPAEVEVFEPVGGDWEVLKSSIPHKKQDAHTFTFDAKVPAKTNLKITYRVRVRWC